MNTLDLQNFHLISAVRTSICDRFVSVCVRCSGTYESCYHTTLTYTLTKSVHPQPRTTTPDLNPAIPVHASRPTTICSTPSEKFVRNFRQRVKLVAAFLLPMHRSRPKPISVRSLCVCVCVDAPTGCRSLFFMFFDWLIFF